MYSFECELGLVHHLIELEGLSKPLEYLVRFLVLHTHREQCWNILVVLGIEQFKDFPFKDIHLLVIVDFAYDWLVLIFHVDSFIDMPEAALRQLFDDLKPVLKNDLVRLGWFQLSLLTVVPLLLTFRFPFVFLLCGCHLLLVV